jgi:hypothetical protein
MLMRTETFRQVSGFSPEYFMYAEDMDLCLKVRRAGWRIFHVPHAEIVHHGGTSSAAQGSTFSAVMMREALHAYMRAHHGRQGAALYRLATGAAGAARVAGMAASLPLVRPERRPAIAGAIGRWKAIVRWSVGLERWAEEYFTRGRCSIHDTDVAGRPGRPLRRGGDRGADIAARRR